LTLSFKPQPTKTQRQVQQPATHNLESEQLPFFDLQTIGYPCPDPNNRLILSERQVKIRF